MLIKVAQFTETSILHHLLLVSQHAVMTLGEDLKSFVFTAARPGKSICTCIFPCLVCANQHATARPHSRHCQAEQAIIWVALSLSLPPPPPSPKPWTNTPSESVSLILIYNQVMKHLRLCKCKHTHDTSKYTFIHKSCVRTLLIPI